MSAFERGHLDRCFPLTSRHERQEQRHSHCYQWVRKSRLEGPTPPWRRTYLAADGEHSPPAMITAVQASGTCRTREATFSMPTNTLTRYLLVDSDTKAALIRHRCLEVALATL